MRTWGLFSQLSKIGSLSALKFQKKKIFFFGIILIFLRENNVPSFLLFWIFKLKQQFFNQDHYMTMGGFWSLDFQLSVLLSFNYAVMSIQSIAQRWDLPVFRLMDSLQIHRTENWYIPPLCIARLSNRRVTTLHCPTRVFGGISDDFKRASWVFCIKLWKF